MSNSAVAKMISQTKITSAMQTPTRTPTPGLENLGLSRHC